MQNLFVGIKTVLQNPGKNEIGLKTSFCTKNKIHLLLLLLLLLTLIKLMTFTLVLLGFRNANFSQLNRTFFKVSNLYNTANTMR